MKISSPGGSTILQISGNAITSKGGATILYRIKGDTITSKGGGKNFI